MARVRRNGVLPAALLTLLVVAACQGPATAPSNKPTSAPDPAGPGTTPAPAAVAATMPPAPVAPLRVTVNWPAPAGVMAPLWIAHEAGIFREQGLDATLVNIPSTAVAAQAMLAGELQVSPLDPAAVMQASLAGADFVMLYGQTPGLNFAVMSQPSIREPAGLVGKTVGISRLGAAAHTAALVALRGWGLEPDRDVALRQLGDFGNVLPAFEAGQLDAAIIGLPVRRETAARFHQLLNLMTQGPAFPTTTISAQRAWVAANEEAVRRFGQAWVLSIHRLKTDRALSLGLLRKYLQTDDQQVLDDEYDHAVTALPDAPRVDEGAIALVLEYLVAREPALAGHQAAEWIDARFMRELESSGFVRRATGQ